MEPTDTIFDVLFDGPILLGSEEFGLVFTGRDRTLRVWNVWENGLFSYRNVRAFSENHTAEELRKKASAWLADLTCAAYIAAG